MQYLHLNPFLHPVNPVEWIAAEKGEGFPLTPERGTTHGPHPELYGTQLSEEEEVSKAPGALHSKSIPLVTYI